MKFKEMLQSIISKEKLDPKESKNWDKETWDKIDASFKEAHGKSMSEALAEEKADEKKVESYNAIAGILATAEETPAPGSEEEHPASETPAEIEEKVESIVQENKQLKEDLATQKEQIETLSSKLEPDNPQDTVKKIPFSYQAVHTAEHAFGIEHPMFAAEKRHNQIAMNPSFAEAHKLSTNEQKKVQQQFDNDLTDYGEIISARYKELKERNLLHSVVAMHNAMANGTVQSAEFGVDYSQLSDLMKNQYVVMRTDALIAQILQVKTIFDMFPRRYGVQDYDLIINVLFTEVSAAWQSGKIFKGSADLQPETGHVDDASIKVLWKPLTQIEREYVGYLNTEGSKAIKWGMIEWYAMNLLTKAVQEQTKRYVMGIYFKPEDGKAGSYLNASTGLMHTLKRYINSDKMLPIDDASVRSYARATMYATVLAFLELIEPLLGDQEWDEFTLVLNKRHKQWFVKNLRDEFGTDNDFEGTEEGTMEFPDYDLPIYWLSGMANNDYTMMITKPGNLQCIEFMPGEMLALIFETDFEDVTTRSRWKEGFSAAFVGPRFGTKQELIDNNYEQQQIFINKPVVALADGETAPDAANGYHFLTVANTAGTAITDIANAKQGPGYYIEIGSTTNASTIAKADKFSEITAAFNPTAVGDYILVVLNDAGDKFLELERKVGGVRTSNPALQPTLPENRS